MGETWGGERIKVTEARNSFRKEVRKKNKAGEICSRNYNKLQRNELTRDAYFIINFQMRKDMRGDAFKLKINAKHEHDFGEEKDEGNGHYSKTCKTCDHTVNYEKL